MLLRWNEFKGMNKSVSKYQLPFNYGTITRDAYLDDGRLQTLNKPLHLNVNPSPYESTVKSFYKHYYKDSTTFEYVAFYDGAYNEIKPVRHPLGDDSLQRVYYIANGKLKHRLYGSSYEYDTLLPKPTLPLSYSVSIYGTIQRFFAYTLVRYRNGVEEESTLSETNDTYGNLFITTIGVGSNIRLSWNPSRIVPLAGDYNDEITKIRFYATPIDTTDSTYRYITTVDISAGTVVIANIDSDLILQEEITSPVKLSYDRYTTGVQFVGITSTSYGSLVVADQGSIYISDINKPAVFNAINIYSYESLICNIAAYNNNIGVFTVDAPHILVGNSPESMSSDKAPLDIGLNTSYRNCLVDMGKYIVYPAMEGLIAINTNTFNVISTSLLTQKEWENYRTTYGEPTYAFRWRDWYMLPLGSTLILVFDVVKNIFFELSFKNDDYGVSTYYEVVYYDNTTSELYIINPSLEFGSINIFNKITDSGTFPILFKSGYYRQSIPTNFKYIRVRSPDYETDSILISLYNGDTLIERIVIGDNKIHKLPVGLYDTFVIEITSYLTIEDICVSTTIEEIQQAL